MRLEPVSYQVKVVTQQAYHQPRLPVPCQPTHSWQLCNCVTVVQPRDGSQRIDSRPVTEIRLNSQDSFLMFCWPCISVYLS